MIKEFLLKQTIFKNRLKLLKKKKRLYSSIIKKKDIYNYQLNKFNLIWHNAYNIIPFYKMWKEKYNLPNEIDSLDELKNFPILTKKDIQQNYDLIFKHLKDYSIVSTGGSTGEPTRFPTSKSEMQEIYASTYVARSWWGIEPLDNILMFWGHSHLFGRGIKGQINQCKRILADWFINTKRLNAYDMSVDTLKNYYKIVKNSNPKAILGYTSAIYRLAKHIYENELDIGNKQNLKCVIVTSETVTKTDIDLIEKVFKVPCVIEYGMVEAGVIAYSYPKENIKILWDNFIVYSKENELIITTIYNKLFPLINYKTGDYIEKNEGFIFEFNQIDGRRNDEILLKAKDDFIEVHSEFFTHILKNIDDIIDFRVVQKIDLTIEIWVDNKNIEQIKEEIFSKISLEFKDFDKNQFKIVYKNKMPLTIAGKTKWIIREE
jgi:phenylacetate-CoA ligase